MGLKVQAHKLHFNTKGQNLCLLWLRSVDLIGRCSKDLSNFERFIRLPKLCCTCLLIKERKIIAPLIQNPNLIRDLSLGVST